MDWRKGQVLEGKISIETLSFRKAQDRLEEIQEKALKEHRRPVEGQALYIRKMTTSQKWAHQAKDAQAEEAGRDIPNEYCRHWRIFNETLAERYCYDPGPYHQFPLIFHHLFLRSQSLVPHLFPYVPLGPPPNHLTSHLMDHLTIPQSDITCHHSVVCSILQHHHLTHYGLPAHCHIMIDRQLMMELYLGLTYHDEPY